MFMCEFTTHYLKKSKKNHGEINIIKSILTYTGSKEVKK